MGAFYSSSTGSVNNAAKVSVAGGATLALGVGTATGSFNATDVGTVLAGTSFAAGANIGFDTTNAGSTGFTYSSAITDSSNGPLGVVKLGSNALYLTNPTGSVYTGGTTVSGGTLYANNTGGTSYSAPSSDPHPFTTTNTSNSATGSGAVTVNSGGVLAGSGTIATSAGVTIKGGGSLASGTAQAGAPALTGTGLTLYNTPLTVGSATGTANLTFDLAAGNPNGASFFSVANPNSSTTYLSLAGSSTMNFVIGSTVSISLVDLTNGALSLRQSVPYLLVQAASDADYMNLVTRNADGTLALDGNGYVMGVYTGSSNANGYEYTPITLTEFGSDGVTLLSNSSVYGRDESYLTPQLYLYNGDLEVVPEPGTWAMMLGGLLFLVLCQRSRGVFRADLFSKGLRRSGGTTSTTAKI